MTTGYFFFYSRYTLYYDVDGRAAATALLGENIKKWVVFGFSGHFDRHSSHCRKSVLLLATDHATQHGVAPANEGPLAGPRPTWASVRPFLSIN